MTEVILSEKELPSEEESEEKPTFVVEGLGFPDKEGIRYDFQITVPDKMNHLDFLTFLWLVRSDISRTYQAALDLVIQQYLDLNEEVTVEAATLDIEEYIRASVDTLESEK